MEFFNFIQKDKQGSFICYLPKIPDATSITASIYQPSGTEDGTATVTYTATTASLMSGSQPGDYILYASSTSFLKRGDKFIVTNTSQDIGTVEFVTIKSFNTTSNTVTTSRQILLEHLYGDIIGSSKLKITIPSSKTGTIGKGYRVQISYNVGGEAQDPITVPFQVTRYLPISNLTIEHLRDLDPTLAKKIPSGFNFEEVKSFTWNAVLSRVAANYSPGALVGTIDLTLPHSYYVKMIMFESAGVDYDSQRELMATRFDIELKHALAASTFDENQDGNANESYVQKIQLYRV